MIDFWFKMKSRFLFNVYSKIIIRSLLLEMGLDSALKTMRLVSIIVSALSFIKWHSRVYFSKKALSFVSS